MEQKIDINNLDEYITTFKTSFVKSKQINENLIYVEFDRWKFVQSIGKKHNQLTNTCTSSDELIDIAYSLLRSISSIKHSTSFCSIHCEFIYGESYLKNFSFNKIEQLNLTLWK